MTTSALGHALERLRDGVTGFAGARPRPMPLAAMRVEVAIEAGLAVVTTTRRFFNVEDEAVEAVLTFPVAFDAVVTGLSAQVDGRTLVATAKARAEAREIYEDALGRGKLAVLHEEVLKGVHVLSVGQLAPGAEVVVTVETAAPLALVGSTPLLRIPTTVGEIYGNSPLMPADDLVTGPGALVAATLAASTDRGTIVLDDDLPLAGEAEVRLDRPIVLRVVGGTFGERAGRDAFGRSVQLALAPAPSSARSLHAAVLFDRSGSTRSAASTALRNTGETVWQVMQRGLASAFAALQPEDRISLWQFDSGCEHLGDARGAGAAGALLARLGEPAGGTELGAAVEQLARAGLRDILVLTDGQTHAREAQEAAARGCRVSAILVGEGSLDAGVGHLAGLTGGHVAWTPGTDAASVIGTMLDGLRVNASAATGTLDAGRPAHVGATRGGVAITARWKDGQEGAAGPCDVVGRYAAALALPLLQGQAAESFAAAHGLCTHLTSLVLVDEAGEAQEGLPSMRKVTLMDRLAAAGSVMPCAMDIHAAPQLDGMLSEDMPLSRGPQNAAIDWAGVGHRLAAGDLDAVPRVLRGRLIFLSSRASIREFAAALGIPPLLAVVALLARLDGEADRHARRVADRLLAGADGVLLMAATMDVKAFLARP